MRAKLKSATYSLPILQLRKITGRQSKHISADDVDVLELVTGLGVYVEHRKSGTYVVIADWTAAELSEPLQDGYRKSK